MDVERRVADYYGSARLSSAILEALRKAGRDTERLRTADLSGADELHLGWAPATAELGRDLGLSPGMRILDIGCGIGGPARHFAETHGCRVVGIDLTADFVMAAEDLTRRCGLSDRATFRQASALALPFDDAAFDAATLIHVGMNISDKPRLFSEARRVLKRGGSLGVYDIMRAGAETLVYPMPWAMTAETSFVERPETYATLLAAAGFTIEARRDRSDFVLRLADDMREKATRDGPPVLGPRLMGADMPERIANVMRALRTGLIAPIEFIARAA